MAKMYYTLEEVMSRLGVSEDQLRGYIRDGKLREFRDAGKLNYRIDEVDRLARGHESGELSLEDSTEIPLSAMDSDPGRSSSPAGSRAGLSSSGSLSGSGSLPGLGLSGSSPAMGLSGTQPAMGGTEAPIDLSGSGSGEISLGGSSGTGIRLEDSKAGSSGELRLDDSKSGSSGADVIRLDEVDKDAGRPMKKDDTVITNIGISVFDDEDLEIAADPMAKTLMTGGDEHLGLDGSGGGSGLLDLTRESDDTSLGAELLEGIDMGDTAATMAQSVDVTQQEPGVEAEAAPLDVGPLEGPGVAVLPVAHGGYVVEAASPAFTGLLIAAAIVLTLAGGMAIATSLNTWPAYLNMLASNFWIFLAGGVVLGAICAGIGYVVGQPRTPRAPRPAKEKLVKEKKVKEKKK